MNTFIKTISIFLLLFMSSVAMPVFATEIFFDAEKQSFAQGEEFLAQVFLNTENEDINAIEGKIIFPNDLLELKEIKDGNSVINFWIEQPKLEQVGSISFSGIIPGGFKETKGFLFSFIFQAKTSGNGAIEIGDAKVLLNDGEGTEAKTATSNFQFSISKQTISSEPQVLNFKDIDPPEEFRPEISSNLNIFNGQWFLVFATQDKGLGIDYYKVCEGNKTKCVIAESPYLLKDQKLRSNIYIKAIDKAGNERIVSLPPRYPLAWYENYLIWIIIILVVLLTISIGYLIKKFLWRKFTKSR